MVETLKKRGETGRIHILVSVVTTKCIYYRTTDHYIRYTLNEWNHLSVMMNFIPLWNHPRNFALNQVVKIGLLFIKKKNLYPLLVWIHCHTLQIYKYVAI